MREWSNNEDQPGKSPILLSLSCVSLSGTLPSLSGVPASQAGSDGGAVHNDVESSVGLSPFSPVSGGSLGTFTSGLSCVPASQDVQVGREGEADHNDFEPSLGLPVSLGSEASLEADHVDVEPSLGSPVSPGSEDSEGH